MLENKNKMTMASSRCKGAGGD